MNACTRNIPSDARDFIGQIHGDGYVTCDKYIYTVDRDAHKVTQCIIPFPSAFQHHAASPGPPSLLRSTLRAGTDPSLPENPLSSL